jgi:hypothetical protein
MNVCAGRMSISPPSTARGSQVVIFEGAIPHEVAPVPPEHGFAVSPAGQAPQEAAQGQAAPPPAPSASQGMAQGLAAQATAFSCAPASAQPACPA